MPCRSAEQVRSSAAMEDRGNEKQILASSSGGTFVRLILMLWKLELYTCGVPKTLEGNIKAYICDIIFFANLKGDPKYSEWGPKGDLILSKKGTKKGTQNLSCSLNRKEITVEINIDTSHTSAQTFLDDIF